MIHFHLIHNNITYNNKKSSIYTPIQAIEFTSENDVAYSKYGDPDDLGTYLISFLNSSMTKNIEEFETFLFLHNINQEKCRVYGTNNSIHEIIYHYHVCIDVHTNKILDISIESKIDNSKLIKIFPDFFENIQKLLEIQ